MTFNIKFDYRFDTSGFFDDPERRQILEKAGEYWSAIIQDEFTDLFSTGNITSVAISSVSYTSPTEYTVTEEFQSVTLTEPIDDLLIFVYGLELPETASTVASGGPSGSFLRGSEEETRFNGADFEPWMGSIYFNTSKDFLFDTTPETNDVLLGQTDFFTVAVHEIGHVLGFGTSQAFNNLVNNQVFTGNQAVLVNNSLPVPLDESEGHLTPDFTFNGQSNLLMKPELYPLRMFPSSLELAILEDIGYETFDSAIYLASHNDLLSAFGSNSNLAFDHYLNYGIFEGRAANLFDPSQYLASHDDLINFYGNNPSAATEHFLQFGFTEGRQRDTFKEDIYLASHGDLIQAFGYNLEAATQHYLNYGFSEGRAKELFDPVAYLNRYPDLQAAFGNDTTLATWHYISYGFAEGRF